MSIFRVRFWLSISTSVRRGEAVNLWPHVRCLCLTEKKVKLSNPKNIVPSANHSGEDLTFFRVFLGQCSQKPRHQGTRLIHQNSTWNLEGRKLQKLSNLSQIILFRRMMVQNMLPNQWKKNLVVCNVFGNDQAKLQNLILLKTCVEFSRKCEDGKT